MALTFKPKMMVAGASSYPRVIDCKQLVQFQIQAITDRQQAGRDISV
jgi:glycine/serine hydroxymethyltransferase